MTYSYVKANYARLRKEAIKRGETFSIFAWKKKKTADPEYVKKYRKERRDFYLAYRKKYYRANKEKLREYHRVYKKTHPWDWRYYYLSKKYGKEWQMTKFELGKIWKTCKAGEMVHPVLKREDEGHPWVYENCVFIEL